MIASLIGNTKIDERKIEEQYSRNVFAERALYKPGCLILSLPDSCGGHDFQLLARGELFFKLDVHLLLQFLKVLRLFDMAEHVLHQSMQDIQTVYLVALGNRKIKADQRNDVGL